MAQILNDIRESAKTGKGNLLALCIEAARRRVTLGEMSDAMEETFGRYKANIKTISGVYAMNAGKNEYFEKALNLTQKFEEEEGRRPRIMVAKMGQDGHDRGAKVVATAFADMGFDVDVAPLFQTPEEVAKQAVENDIHILGVSSLAAGHKTLVPQVVENLRNWELTMLPSLLEELFLNRIMNSCMQTVPTLSSVREPTFRNVRLRF